MKNILNGVVKVDKDNLIEYDSYERTPEECSYYLDSYEPIGGSRVKKFYRAKTSMLAPLIDEIAYNPDCSYVTPFNQLIADGYKPDCLSVLVKGFEREGCEPEDFDSIAYEYCIYHDGMREVLCSRINNYMGVPTTYEMLILDEKELKVLSVDFGNSDKKFYSFDEIDCIISCDLQQDVECLSKMLDRMYTSTSHDSDMVSRLICTVDKNYTKNRIIDREEFDKQKNKFIEDYIYSYLVRDIILGDYDIHSANFGIMIGEDMSIQSAPSFDLEGALGYEDGYKFTYSALENLRWVACYHENIFMKFRNKVKELLKIKEKDKFGWKDVLFKDISSEIPEEIINVFEDHLEEANNLCDKTIYIPDNFRR